VRKTFFANNALYAPTYLFLDEEKKAYYGGGNIRDKGGFQIPLGFLGHHADRELLYRMTCEIVQAKFLEALGRKA